MKNEIKPILEAIKKLIKILQDQPLLVIKQLNDWEQYFAFQVNIQLNKEKINKNLNGLLMYFCMNLI